MCRSGGYVAALIAVLPLPPGWYEVPLGRADLRRHRRLTVSDNPDSRQPSRTRSGMRMLERRSARGGHEDTCW
jgi:hypothetical protein